MGMSKNPEGLDPLIPARVLKAGNHKSPDNFYRDQALLDRFLQCCLIGATLFQEDNPPICLFHVYASQKVEYLWGDRLKIRSRSL